MQHALVILPLIYLSHAMPLESRPSPVQAAEITLVPLQPHTAFTTVPAITFVNPKGNVLVTEHASTVAEATSYLPYPSKSVAPNAVKSAPDHLAYGYTNSPASSPGNYQAQTSQSSLSYLQPPSRTSVSQPIQRNSSAPASFTSFLPTKYSLQTSRAVRSSATSLRIAASSSPFMKTSLNKGQASSNTSASIHYTLVLPTQPSVQRTASPSMSITHLPTTPSSSFTQLQAVSSATTASKPTLQQPYSNSSILVRPSISVTHTSHTTDLQAVQSDFRGTATAFSKLNVSNTTAPYLPLYHTKSPSSKSGLIRTKLPKVVTSIQTVPIVMTVYPTFG